MAWITGSILWIIGFFILYLRGTYRDTTDDIGRVFVFVTPFAYIRRWLYNTLILIWPIWFICVVLICIYQLVKSGLGLNSMKCILLAIGIIFLSGCIVNIDYEHNIYCKQMAKDIIEVVKKSETSQQAIILITEKYYDAPHYEYTHLVYATVVTYRRYMYRKWEMSDKQLFQFTLDMVNKHIQTE